MRRFVAPVVLLCAVLAGSACGNFDMKTGTSATSGAADPSSPAGADAGAAVGKDCAIDPITRVVLCSAISICPELAVDHDVFPHCGFRIRPGGALDLECWCDGYLCPLGAPSSCAQAKQLLAAQSEAAVCVQIDERRCTQPQYDDAGTSFGDSNGGNGGSTCNRQCVAECGGTPGCNQLCGC